MITTKPWEGARYWILHELRRVRASLRVGNISAPNACKERRGLQRDLAALRRNRRGV